MEKIISYLGFAIKANKIVYGIDNLVTCKKKLFLILLCPTCSEKSKNIANRIAQKLNCDIKTTTQNLSKLLHKDNCKTIAICDYNLSQAILSCKNNLVEVNIG